MNSFKDLKVWQKSFMLVKDVYLKTKGFPKEEQYGLTQQIRRASVSIPSNIAEGAGRGSSKQFEYFLSIALGSSFELETQLLLSKELRYITEDELLNLSENLIEIQKMIRGLQKSLK